MKNKGVLIVAGAAVLILVIRNSFLSLEETAFKIGGSVEDVESSINMGFYTPIMIFGKPYIRKSDFEKRHSVDRSLA